MDRPPSRQPHLLDMASVIAAALAEDLGEDWAVTNDLTASATVPAGTTASGRFVVREEGVVAGVDAVTTTYQLIDEAVEVLPRLVDGARVEPGDVVAEVSGPARAILVGERTALNLLTHLSGVATATRALVDAVAGGSCMIRDTRKTLPGLRALEKAAVRAGGGANHRMSLVDELLVKDNHVAAAGGIDVAAKAALSGADGHPVQIEVDSLEQLDIVLAAGCRRVMLDNFSLADTVEGVRRCRLLDEDVFVEASGGITEQTISAVAATGVDAIAVGALTHSSGALDIGLDFTVERAG